MRNVDAHLLEDKMDDAVTHYINSHQTAEHVHVDENTLALNVHDDGGGRVVTVMHQAFSTQMCRHPAVGEQVSDGPWSDVLLEDPGKLAALVAQHLEQHTRTSHHIPSHTKITSMRSDVESSVMLDGPLRLFNSQALDQHTDSIVVQVPSLAPLPPLQDMKRCQDSNWFHNKSKATLKVETPILSEPDGQILELSAVPSPAQNKQQCKKSLPHKKRISKKLKRNAGNSTPQQDIVVLNSDEVHQEEILPDSFVSDVPHPEHLQDDTHHITNGVRSVFICQLCGEYYAEEQFKFFQHLKQHYEPATIIIENPVPDLGIDKMTNTCIVDNVSTLPDSIVELTLDNSVPKTIYQPTDKHILYTSSDKTLNYVSNKMQYSMASMEKEPLVVTDVDKNLYDTLDKLDFYCMKCNKSFKKQKQCEAHVKEVHANPKLEDMGEFSEPEDLMEGIHVTVEETGEQYEPTLIPHLTVENGHVHQEHVRYWYLRNNSPSNAGLPCGGDEFCPVCPNGSAPPAPPPPLRDDEPPTHHLKGCREVLQRIFEVEVANSENPPNFTDNIIPDTEEPQTEVEIHEVEIKTEEIKSGKKKSAKEFNCLECGRIFLHRNSLLYHVLSHNGKQHICRECGKGFYTTGALKIHKRVHNGDRPYKCEECGRDFRQWSDLKYHKVSLHSNQKSFKCDFCEKEFARKYSLNVHRRIHTGERNYKCEYCNKSFRASSYRLSHMRTHTGDKPYKCEECEKCFRVAGDLRRHMLIHDKVRNKMDQSKKEKDNKETKKSIRKTHNVKSKDSEIVNDPSPTKSNTTRKVAIASTAKPQNSKNATDKKQMPKPSKKSQIKKLSAPNVTVNPIRLSELQYKEDNSEYTDVEVFDARQVNGTYSKFKDVYSSDSNEFNKDNPYEKVKDYEQGIITDYKDSVERLTEEREYSILRPMYRGNTPLCEEVSDKNSYTGRVETTDGKMLMIEKNSGSLVSNQVLSDIRHLEREVVRDIRDSLHGEPMENGFIERLTALYNIQTV